MNGNTILGLASLIVGLASLAVLVSDKAKTVQILDTGSKAVSRILNSATNPFSGGWGAGLN